MTELTVLDKDIQHDGTNRDAWLLTGRGISKINKLIRLLEKQQAELKDAYSKGFKDGTKHKSEQVLKIRELRKQGKTYGQIKKELGIKWTNSIVHALKEEK
jgi:hypothetical protein